MCPSLSCSLLAFFTSLYQILATALSALIDLTGASYLDLFLIYTSFLHAYCINYHFSFSVSFALYFILLLICLYRMDV